MHPTIKNKMRKGFLRIISIGLIAVAPVGAAAFAQIPQPAQEVIEVVEAPVNADAQVKEDHTPLALQEPDVFTSDYGESKIAKKMTQAEKNRNAAENDGWGGAITIIAMCIVISALVVLSILFFVFGKISEALITKRKKKAKAAADHPENEEHLELSSGEVIAAISIALTEYFGNPHDIEDTHLTIRKLQKVYSPWNSKIYNLRQNQDHKRNPSTEINFHESKRIQI